MANETKPCHETPGCEASVLSDLLSVFVLLDCTQYEGCEPLRAFKFKEQAEVLKAMAEAHDSKAPRCPNSVEDSPSNDAEWDEFEKQRAVWRDNHPIKKGFSGAEFYAIVEIPFSA